MCAINFTVNFNMLTVMSGGDVIFNETIFRVCESVVMKPLIRTTDYIIISSASFKLWIW